MAEQSRIWHEEIVPALAEGGIEMVSFTDLSAADRRDVDEHFDREVYPVLTPLAVGPGLPFPYISGLSLNLGLRVRDPVKGETRFARIKVPPRLPRFLPVDGRRLVRLEDVIRCHVERLFPGMEVLDTSIFRVTRDADFSISDESDDLLGAVEAQLRRRRFGHVVRLEVERGRPRGPRRGADRGARGGRARHVPHRPAPLDFTSLWALATLDRPDLRDPPWEPRTRPRLRPEEGEKLDIFAAIRAGDILVHHPYDDFHTSVERFVEQAVEDPNVLAIKQTMYRTSGDSPIVPALMRAAEQGKQTVVPGGGAGPLRRGAQHPVGARAGALGRPRRLRAQRPQDPRQARAGGAPRGRPRAPLRPLRHGQLQPLDGAPVHGPRAVHLPRGRGRGRGRPLQPPHRLRAAADVPSRPGGARGPARRHHPRDRAGHRRALRGVALAGRAQAQLDHRRAHHPGASTAPPRPAWASTSSSAASPACARASPASATTCA